MSPVFYCCLIKKGAFGKNIEMVNVFVCVSWRVCLCNQEAPVSRGQMGLPACSQAEILLKVSLSPPEGVTKHNPT